MLKINFNLYKNIKFFYIINNKYKNYIKINKIILLKNIVSLIFYYYYKIYKNKKIFFNNIS